MVKKNMKDEGDSNANLAIFAKHVRETTALPKLPTMPRTAKERPTSPCQCGCDGLTKARFVPGHNGRPAGWAMRVERGVCTINDVPDGERQVVEITLRERAADSAPVETATAQ
jgi:hypothetical protein